MENIFGTFFTGHHIFKRPGKRLNFPIPYQWGISNTLSKKVFDEDFSRKLQGKLPL
ncbi:hypothetical protein SK237_00270 [Novacetimonas hansenii]|uniref:hypothetical protein n=1 Tax=Novacetimonas hansenii TaxID=436 RepID=UPI000A631527|nr:hypothetical protein [Novacetimonas hansenii]